jgi:hypothetical protein
MSAADEVARLEAETATAVSAAAVAQGAAAAAVADAEALKHEVTRDAAEAIRERDAEIARLKEREEWLTNETTRLASEMDSLEMAIMGLVAMANPPVESAPSTPPPEPSSVVVVDPEAAKTPENPKEPETSEENPTPPEKPKKRHKLL